MDEGKSTSTAQKGCVDDIFKKMLDRIGEDENSIVIAPTYYPETCSILKQFADNGIQTVIVGGNDNKRLFQNVEQIPVDFTCSGVDSENDENTEKIINQIPVKYLNGKRVYLYQFMHYNWKGFLEKRLKREGIKCDIIADMTQGFEAFFEAKHRLPNVLDGAGLGGYKIPNKVIASTEQNLSDNNLAELYNEYKCSNGKVVLQLCGDKYQEIGGGEGTKIVDNLADFIDKFKEMKEKHKEADIKISKFVLGVEGNMSFITLPRTTGGQVARLYSKSLEEEVLGIQAGNLGINKDATVSIAGRMTLKCVGHELLTSKSGSGVGNDLGYFHTDNTIEDIYKIAQNLGKYMASLGKWGLAGCDIKITPDGKVYIIEINNRQQGPTAQMSEDAERNGLPSLIKMQTIYAFGNQEEVFELHEGLKGHEKDISEGYSRGNGSFYVKVAATKDSEIKTGFEPGFYNVEKDGTKWKWDLEHPLENITQEEALEFNQKSAFNGDKLIMELRAGAPRVGLELPAGNQICRIVGLSSETFPSPFVASENKEKVDIQEGWKGLIGSFKETVLTQQIAKEQKANEEYLDINMKPAIIRTLVSYNMLNTQNTDNVFAAQMPEVGVQIMEEEQVREETEQSKCHWITLYRNSGNTEKEQGHSLQ